MTWYYVGQVGQVGPFLKEEMVEFIDAKIVKGDTYVWCDGFNEWVRADACDEFRTSFPHPSFQVTMPTTLPPVPLSGLKTHASNEDPQLEHIKARSRRTAGWLQIWAPGMGRIYIGDITIGIIQIIIVPVTCCIGYLWPLTEGLLYLTGAWKNDSEGNPLQD